MLILGHFAPGYITGNVNLERLSYYEGVYIFIYIYVWLDACMSRLCGTNGISCYAGEGPVPFSCREKYFVGVKCVSVDLISRRVYTLFAIFLKEASRAIDKEFVTVQYISANNGAPYKF